MTFCPSHLTFLLLLPAGIIVTFPPENMTLYLSHLWYPLQMSSLYEVLFSTVYWTRGLPCLRLAKHVLQHWVTFSMPLVFSWHIKQTKSMRGRWTRVENLLWSTFVHELIPTSGSRLYAGQDWFDWLSYMMDLCLSSLLHSLYINGSGKKRKKKGAMESSQLKTIPQLEKS